MKVLRATAETEGEKHPATHSDASESSSGTAVETRVQEIRKQVELEGRARLAEERLADLKAQLEEMRRQRDKWQEQAERLALAPPSAESGGWASWKGPPRVAVGGRGRCVRRALAELLRRRVGCGGGGERMFDESNASRTVEPRLSVQVEDGGTWSAFRGAILLATGLATVTEAWDVIDRAASARPPATPIRSPDAPERSRRSWRRSA